MQSIIKLFLIRSPSNVNFKIQGSRVQTRLRLMDFSGSKIPEHKSSGRVFKLVVPSLRFQAR
jgi:hypothetical protein